MELLGGLSPELFLQRHWQKRPLLVRGAVPGFGGLLQRSALARLAGHDDVHARCVTTRPKGRGPRYQLDEGPFPGLDLDRCPQRDFTLLVGGLEAHVEGAWDLLARFAFVPWARIDDLMVSFAQPGGSVGPHYDLYDVFLLQGPGRRRWQIGAPDDLEVDEREEVRVLRRFVPTEEWVLEPGDMLYLPPRIPHHGVAIEPCFTYSIGFSAPTHEQLLHNFLAFLGEGREPPGMYEDPELAPSAHPGELGDEMVARTSEVLASLRWDDDDVARFLGRLLTGPKPHTPRPRPHKRLPKEGFERALLDEGTLMLSNCSRLLVRGSTAFLDGECLTLPQDAHGVMARIADARRCSLPQKLSQAGTQALYALYRRGVLELSSTKMAPRGEPRPGARRRD
ncbi:MAG: JmjC domain-containing protein [Myxococcota bacterium]